MPDASHNNEQWLTLKQAASRLSVHPATLRRWADNGDIAVLLTPGGHRRFSSTDINRFSEERKTPASRGRIEQSWAEDALIHTRHELATHQEDRWLKTLSEDVRLRSRIRGQRLMGLLLQYISVESADESILPAVKAIGCEYAYELRESGLGLTEAMRATMFFRDVLVESTTQLPEAVPKRIDSNRRLLRRLSTFLNVIQLAVVEAYESSSSHPVSWS